MQKTHFITRIYRIFRVIVHIIAGLMLAAFILPLVNKNTQPEMIKWWCKGLLNAFNIQVKLFGAAPSNKLKGGLFVANHVSWVDIHALNSLINVRFIAKSTIKDWPIFGYLATKANPLFVDREKSQTAGKIVNTCTESLLAGENLCFFPEGTTSDGQQVLPFKSSIMQAAIGANALIWPVAIRYLNDDGNLNTEMAYAGGTTLAQSMLSILKVKNPVVELHFLKAIEASGQTRRQLTQNAYDAIVAKLAL